MKFFSALLRSRNAVLGAFILSVFVAGAVLAPVVAPMAPTQTDLRGRLSPPSLSLTEIGKAPLGRDQLGRDVFSRILYGSRITLAVALASVVVGGIVGVGVGLYSGYRGGLPDQIIMRVVDVQLAFPLMLLALVVVAAVGPSIGNLIAVLALTSWTRYARIVRGEVLALKHREFILSAHTIGANPWRIAFQHILPNVLMPVIVVATLELARVIVLESSLSFLGIGVQPPYPSWGRMLAEGRSYISSAWWLATFPGLAIMLVVLSVNLLGDWLRDTLDPRQRERRQ
ncbi:ABC transporter permease [Microvirga antarctica]|uniref:ABC transporter permease n=1 Tax=Microvirga antarctica TaxID=2819233 RepID=UPI001B30EE58|nr:ABC transporter permease [Microvirga antarctica]